MRRCQGSYTDQGLYPPNIEELAQRCAEGPPMSRGHLREELDALLREAKDKFRGYDSCSTPEHAELAYKKVPCLSLLYSLYAACGQNSGPSVSGDPPWESFEWTRFKSTVFTLPNPSWLFCMSAQACKIAGI